MKKAFLLVITAFLATYTVKAQNDPNAKKILDAVSTKVKSYKAITGKFVLKTFTSAGKLNGTKTGSISMKGSKYILKQGKTEVICDGSKTYTFDGSKTITVAAAEEEGKTLTPQKILSGSYDKDFTYKLISTKGNFNKIELKPVDKRKNFNKVNLFIDKTKSMITKATILDKSNNTLEFTFNNLNTNATLADKIFVFDKNKYPSDVEILD
ncbi:MAG: outer membrane lipoprotein carrier protein LolA [Chitinophagaceae bacterium]|nr:outer membrane lipoprotein carrier protein LolA [Chitinophagaceae bacterium]MCW5905744.1 outer membrane lipoprotein carrier protein LolA [Chitinophagaceae bacterium]